MVSYCMVWYSVCLPNASDLWQPVGAGYGEMLKTLIEQEHHKWLDNDEDADRWYENEQPHSAKDRHIIITHWACEALQVTLWK